MRVLIIQTIIVLLQYVKPHLFESGMTHKSVDLFIAIKYSILNKKYIFRNELNRFDSFIFETKFVFKISIAFLSFLGHGAIICKYNIFITEFCSVERPGQPVRYIREGYKKRVSKS